MKLRLCITLIASLLVTDARAAFWDFLPWKDTQTAECVLYRIQKVRSAKDWLAFPHTNSKVSALVEKILNLPPTEKQIALEEFRKNPPQDPELKKIVGLSLFDETTWDDYFERFSKQQKTRELHHSLVPLLEKMPDTLKRKYLAKIGDIYTVAVKKLGPFIDSGGGEIWHEGPKRALDVFISYTLKPQDFFENMIQQGKTPLEAWDAFLKNQKGIVFKNSEIGSYSASQIYSVAKEIQFQLTEMQAKHPELANTELTLYGSLPNGRALLNKSDIDMDTNAEGFESYDPQLQNKLLLVTQSIFGTRLPTSISKQTANERRGSAIQNPIHLRITGKKIELLIYPQEPITRQAIATWPDIFQPTVYVLE